MSNRTSLSRVALLQNSLLDGGTLLLLRENNDEDLKVIDVSPIRSMFCNMNFDDYGSDDESTFPRRHPKNSESLDLDVKFGKREIGEPSTSNNIEPTISDFKEFDYDNCSLKGCISLLQSIVNSPHAYSQNKAFTKHIVDALMQFGSFYT